MLNFYLFYLEDLLLLLIFLVSIEIILRIKTLKANYNVLSLKVWYSFIEFFAFLILVLSSLFLFSGVRLMKASGVSMEPTLDTKSVLITNVYSYGVRFPFLDWFGLPSAPKKGDVVTLQAEIEGRPENLTKRVVASEGDFVEYKNGFLYVNEIPVLLNGKKIGIKYSDNVPMEEFRINENSHKVLVFKNDSLNFKVRIPMGMVFVMGDNWGLSYDSRQFGSVPIENIRGKVLFDWSWVSGWKRTI